MTSGAALLSFLTIQRLFELVISARNTRSLRARGALEFGARHYPAMIALHGSWLVSLWFFGWNRPALPALVLVFALLQAARIWVMATLGERWTTRIIVPLDEPPIHTGPFRFVRHPNYLIVAIEIPCVSLALGLAWHAALFTILNLTMLWWRIRAEDRAYAAQPPASP
ncbi:MAG: hypothetical protein M3N19_08005 [Candidatus Eremiobacteraeota bacterium]|nr:hypothetical protein [Candidatus Eremiobacteraeota bacterium]